MYNKTRRSHWQGIFINSTERTGWLHYHHYADETIKTGSLRPFKIEDFPETKKAVFHPLGVNFHAPSRTLYVVNHGEHPAGIEVFTLSDDAETLTFERTITHPLLRTPNSVQPVSDHEIYVSNDHHYEVRDHPILSKLENFAHIAKGNVLYINLKTNETKIAAEFSFPNGIAQLNKTHLAIATTTGLAVNIFEIQPDHSLNKTLHIQADFWVDNLRVDSAGTLLLTGHPHALIFEVVVKNQHKYNLDAGRLDGLDPSTRPRTGSWVAEWDGNAEGKIKNLFIDDGSEYGTSTTTVRDTGRGVGFVVGLYEKGIVQFEA